MILLETSSLWLPLMDAIKSFINYLWAYLTFIPLAIIVAGLAIGFIWYKKALMDEEYSSAKSAKELINKFVIALIVFAIIFFGALIFVSVT